MPRSAGAGQKWQEDSSVLSKVSPAVLSPQSTPVGQTWQASLPFTTEKIVV